MYGLLLGTKYIPAILTVNNKRAGGRMDSRTDRTDICFWRFCVIAKSGDDPQESLAKFGYKLSMGVKFLSILLYFRLPTRTMYRHMAIFLSFFSRIIAIENVKKHIISVVVTFYIAFFGYI